MTKESARKIQKMVQEFANDSMNGDVEYKVFGRRVIIPDLRKELLIKRQPILKEISRIPSKIWKAAEDIGVCYDLRSSEVREVELACYGVYWKKLDRTSKFLMAAVVNGKIRIDQLDSDQLLKFLSFPTYNVYLSLGHGSEAPNYIKRLFDEEPKEEPVEKPKANKVKKIRSMEDLEKACEEPIKASDLLAIEKKDAKSILDEDDTEVKFV